MEEPVIKPGIAGRRVLRKVESIGRFDRESTIKGGEVMASAQGTKNGGTAQTQVSGTYTGKGSFSATAQTSDKDRSAQAQISGGKEGAMTSSQGTFTIIYYYF